MSLLPVRQFWAENQTTVLPKPPHSPDLVSCDFSFPKMKSVPKGHTNDINTNSSKVLQDISKAFQSLLCEIETKAFDSIDIHCLIAKIYCRGIYVKKKTKQTSIKETLNCYLRGYFFK